MGDNTDLQSTGLMDFLSDALNSTLMADANSVEVMQDALEEYGDETLEFTITDDSDKKHIVKIPKLAVAPMPLLRIQEASFEVEGELTMNSNTTESKDNSGTNATSTATTAATSGTTTTVNKTLVRNLRVANRQAVLKKALVLKPVSTTSGSSSSNTTNNSTSLKVKINVKMAQADVPAGLTNLLQIAANNLRIEDAPAEGTPAK